MSANYSTKKHMVWRRQSWMRYTPWIVEPSLQKDNAKSYSSLREDMTIFQTRPSSTYLSRREVLKKSLSRKSKEGKQVWKRLACLQRAKTRMMMKRMRTISSMPFAWESKNRGTPTSICNFTNLKRESMFIMRFLDLITAFKNEEMIKNW